MPSFFNWFDKCEHGLKGAAKNPRLCFRCLQIIKDKEIRTQERQMAIEAEYQESRRINEIRNEHYSRLIADRKYLLTMDPLDFEDLCLKVFKRLGYEVEATARSGDNGADGILRKDGKLIVLQAKRFKGSVGEPILRDLLGTMHHFNADSAILVTTGNLTKMAAQWIQGKPIELLDLALFSQKIGIYLQSGESISPRTPDFGPERKKFSYKQQNHCPKCHAKLTRRVGSFGSFWGCSAYPKCNYTRKYKSSP